ncbi:unnamed protein product [Bursaphelenchus okinawaensis]|uniref:Uncharacterized protein n=1 Tax=Bursaphelenchus okinawaensis TaxID=465554 RepID=A0A811KPH2_9BILA|nr:unnamed protein product [Bursaphelenchus okinawaensis]CAG9110143.1 unnamed protein product [Bursaphelenchus okinawaensis]
MGTLGKFKSKFLSFWEEDIFWDDHISNNVPKDNGEYVVSSYGEGGWFDGQCEPYVLIYNWCNSNCHVYKTYNKKANIDLYGKGVESSDALCDQAKPAKRD